MSVDNIFKALSDKTRRKIIKLINERGQESCCSPGLELCVCEIAQYLNITAPNLSYHLDFLTESGLLSRRRQGIRIYYRINHEMLSKAVSIVADMAEEALV